MQNQPRDRSEPPTPAIDGLTDEQMRTAWNERMKGWTPARILVLTVMAPRFSASQIARQLGNISRGAVIGKARRIGVALRSKGPGIPTRPRAKPPAAPRAKPKRPNWSVKKRPGEAVPPTPIVEPEPAPVAPQAPDPVEPRMLTLLELADRDCRFPIGDPRRPGFGFCGAARHGDGPYCEMHAARAYSPRETEAQAKDRERLAALS